MFSLPTVKRKEAGENGCSQELELHICVVRWTTSFANEQRVEFGKKLYYNMISQQG